MRAPEIARRTNEQSPTPASIALIVAAIIVGFAIELADGRLTLLAASTLGGGVLGAVHPQITRFNLARFYRRLARSR
jgi:hypothetical protein